MSERAHLRSAERRSTGPTSGEARWAAAVALVAFAAYALVVPGVSSDKDGSEFTLVLATFGLSHPTGYPLYTLIGHAFVALVHAAGASWDRAANLWSALGGAAALGLVHALAARLLRFAGVEARAARWVALLPVTALAFNPAWTLDATLAEVNSWHLAWVALAALAGIQLLEAARPLSARDGGIWGLVCGLGLAHHRTSVFVIAPFTLAVCAKWWGSRPRRWNVIAIGVLAAALPLLSYGYVFYRAAHPARVQWGGMGAGVAGALRHIMGSEYLLYLGRFAPDPVQRRLIATHVYPWLLPGVALMAIWAWRARAPGAPARLALFACAALSVTYSFVYGVPDPSSYFLPAMMLSLAEAPAAVASLPVARRGARAIVAVSGILIVFALALGARYSVARRAAYVQYDATLHSLWRSIPADSGFVLWPDDMIAHLAEYQLLAGEKPSLELIHPVEITQLAPRGRFIARHGFDPVPTQEIGARARARPPRDVQELAVLIAGAVADQINARSSLPVIWFDPAAGTARVMAKADSPAGK